MRWAACLAALALAAGCLGYEPPRGDGPVTADAGDPDRCGPRPDQEWRGQDWSKETLRFNLQASREFQVDLPVPVSEGGTLEADWLANLQMPTDWSALLQDNPEGSLLRVSGTGSGIVASCSIQGQSDHGNGCCAEQYLDARWTGTTQPRQDLQSLAVSVARGALVVAVEYRAESNWCGAEADFGGPADGPGLHELHGQHMAWCE